MSNNRFHYKDTVKQNKNFMYNDLRKSNCYGSDFTGSNFNYASFRGAHFKSCNFFGCTFKGTEFVGTNLKKSKFKKSKFEDTIFEGANLSGVDFKEAEFKNVILVGTDISECKNLSFDEKEVRIFEEMPELEISNELREAVAQAMTNDKIKASRVLDTKDGSINTISIMILLETLSEKNLISGLKLAAERIDKAFCTISYISRAINNYAKEGLL
ncbi:MAG: pentapeptide repeat-containing protein [Clostridium sp.]